MNFNNFINEKNEGLFHINMEQKYSFKQGGIMLSFYNRHVLCRPDPESVDIYDVIAGECRRNAKSDKPVWSIIRLVDYGFTDKISAFVTGYSVAQYADGDYAPVTFVAQIHTTRGMKTDFKTFDYPNTKFYDTIEDAAAIYKKIGVSYLDVDRR